MKIQRNREIKEKAVLITIMFFLFINILPGQIDYRELVDTSVLNKAEFGLVNKINTEKLEFSPEFYDGGLVYVSSGKKSKKHFDKVTGEGFFVLKLVRFDSLNNIDTIEDFEGGLKIKNHTGPCSFTRDENTMFLSRNKKSIVTTPDGEKDINPMGIYIYRYENGYWIPNGELPVNSYGYKVFHPSWDEKNGRLIFASDMPGGYGGTDLYSIKYKNGKWIELKNLGPGVNSESNEAFPFIFRSEYLFFASKKEGGKGGYDIYFSAERNNDFGIAVNLGKRFNSKSDDFGLILDEMALSGYFTSNRPNGIGEDDIYKFSSESSIFRIFNNYFTLKVLDAISGKPVDKAVITFSKYKLVPTESPRIAKIKGVEKEIIYTIDPTSLKESEPVFTDKNGEYFVRLDKPSYILKINKSGYANYSGIIRASDKNKFFEVKLSPEVLDTFQFSFLDMETKQRLTDIDIQFAGVDEQNINFTNSKYSVVLQRGNKTSFTAEKEGYLSKKIELEYGITPTRFDIVLEKKQKYIEHLPTQAGEIMILKDIYYAYNSAKLSHKAKKELNKLVKHLKAHPELKIELSSHTDSRGKKVYNQKLSEKRSANARKYLIRKGIAPNRIIAKGYGETKLRNHCYDGVKCSEKEHSINRRTEVKVVGQ